MKQRRDLYERYREYERRKRELPPMSPQEYERVVKEICRELGI